MGQQGGLINKISAIQDKVIGIINFKPKNYPTGNLLIKQNPKIKGLKLIDIFYVCKKSVAEDSHLRMFTNKFDKANEIHNYATSNDIFRGI